MDNKKINKDDLTDNPLSDLISNDIYSVLKERDLINEKSVRNHIKPYVIQKFLLRMLYMNFNSSILIYNLILYARLFIIYSIKVLDIHN